MKPTSKSHLKYLSICLIITFSNALSAQEVNSRELSDNIQVDALLYHEDGSILGSGGWNGSNIYKIAPNGNVSTYASGFIGIVDMIWGENDTIIGTSYQDGRLLKIAPDGTSSTFVHSSIGVASLYRDYNGDIICTINPGLAHPSPGKVIKVTPEGNVSTFASGGSIFKPGGATQDEEGNYYISNLGDGRITKISGDGSQELFATIPATGQWKIGYIKFWNGSFYTSAISENKIYETTLDGEVSVYAGDGMLIDQDGVVPDVSFKSPNGMAVAGDTLFVISGLDATNKLRYITAITSSTNEELGDSPGNSLEINFPNPFKLSTNIKYKIASQTFVKLNIYGTKGDHINTIVSKNQQAGDYVVQWDGKDSKGNAMAPGVYFYELSTDSFIARKKMILLK